MVVSIDDIKEPKEKVVSRTLKNIERSIDGELKQNRQRLAEGKEVMVPCLMRVDMYEELIQRYRAGGWEVRHEGNHAFGRLYFKLG
jgi:hypothetical protein